MVSGASNIIIQNIKITDLNPQYVWGGDAITLDDTDLSKYPCRSYYVPLSFVEMLGL
jgi:hypothetical protein